MTGFVEDDQFGTIPHTAPMHVKRVSHARIVQSDGTLMEPNWKPIPNKLFTKPSRNAWGNKRKASVIRKAKKRLK